MALYIVAMKRSCLSRRSAVISACAVLTWNFIGSSSPRYWIVNAPNHLSTITQLGTDDFVTGERVTQLCDIAVYSREYVFAYPTVKDNTRTIVYTGTILEENKTVLQLVANSRTFFVKLDYFDYFVDQIMPHITRRFVLFTHNSDLTAGTVNQVLSSPKLVRWYGCNMMPSRRTKGIPLGLENVDMWKRTDFRQIIRYRGSVKTKLMYFRFSVSSNEAIRSKIYVSLVNNGFHENKRRDWADYIRELSQHKFCASPPGNGVDTHRMWECLYLGVIPIVLKDPILLHWFRDLPIMWIDSFDEITPQSLLRVDLKLMENPAGDVNADTHIFSMAGLKKMLTDDVSNN